MSALITFFSFLCTFTSYTVEKMKGCHRLSGFVTSSYTIWLELPALLGYLKGQAFYKPFSREEEEQVQLNVLWKETNRHGSN